MKDFYFTVEAIIGTQGPILQSTCFHFTPNESYDNTGESERGEWETVNATNVFGSNVRDDGWYEWKKRQSQLDLMRPDPNKIQFKLMKFFGVKDPIEINLQRMDEGMYWVPAPPVKKPKEAVAYYIQSN